MAAPPYSTPGRAPCRHGPYRYLYTTRGMNSDVKAMTIPLAMTASTPMVSSTCSQVPGPQQWGEVVSRGCSPPLPHPPIPHGWEPGRSHSLVTPLQTAPHCRQGARPEEETWAKGSRPSLSSPGPLVLDLDGQGLRSPCPLFCLLPLLGPHPRLEPLKLGPRKGPLVHLPLSAHVPHVPHPVPSAHP